jgi:Bacterial alpha-L-rhamnosidase 6 hairpin glycosidase domain
VRIPGGSAGDRCRAAALGWDEEARHDEDLIEAIRGAFNRADVDPGGRIRGDTQTGYALALRFGLLPEALRPRAADHLVADVRRLGGLSTGYLGTVHLLPALTETGAPFPFHHTLPPHPLPVAPHRHRPILIRAIGGDPRCKQPRQRRFRRVTEDVVPTARDDRQRGVDRVEPGGVGREWAAVVANLQHLRPRRSLVQTP